MIGFLPLLAALWMTPLCETGLCTCSSPRTAEEARGSSAAVFTGMVGSVQDTTITHAATGEAWRMHRVTLRVDRAWQGVESRTVVVSTGFGVGDCGFPFQRGERYLVYAHARDFGLSAGICGRTAPLASDMARTDLRALGEPARTWP